MKLNLLRSLRSNSVTKSNTKLMATPIPKTVVGTKKAQNFRQIKKTIETC